MGVSQLAVVFPLWCCSRKKIIPLFKNLYFLWELFSKFQSGIAFWMLTLNVSEGRAARAFHSVYIFTARSLLHGCEFATFSWHACGLHTSILNGNRGRLFWHIWCHPLLRSDMEMLTQDSTHFPYREFQGCSWTARSPDFHGREYTRCTLIYQLYATFFSQMRCNRASIVTP